MLDDADRVARGSTLAADVCVVGAGAAGITIALELARSSDRRVVVLESGGLDFDEATQDLAAGNATGLPYEIRASRLRYFGGTTNHWGGYCRRLDPIDFETRDWIAHSGWPFERSELVPFYRRAEEICELPVGPEDDFERWRESWENEPGALPVDDELAGVVFRMSPPTRFGSRYRRELADAPGVRVLLHANALVASASGSPARLERLDVATLSGNRFSVEADEFVLAVGGLETARLLLSWGDTPGSSSLPLPNGLVGRFFADHAEALVGEIVLPGELPAAYWAPLLTGRQAVATFTAETQRAERLGNVDFWFREPADLPTSGVEGGVGVTEASELVRRGDVTLEPRAYTVVLQGETEPDPESRVTLTSERDALGMRLLALNWTVGEKSLADLRRAVWHFAERLGAAGRARVRIDVDDVSRFQFHPPFHHMGTARMAASRERGVVDADGRLHGVENLSIAGSAVFPTYGSANPTLTIVALALRLAERLAR